MMQKETRMLGAAIIAGALLLNQQFTLQGRPENPFGDGPTSRFGAAAEVSVRIMNYIGLLMKEWRG